VGEAVRVFSSGSGYGNQAVLWIGTDPYSYLMASDSRKCTALR
jgi:hypothetical protein